MELQHLILLATGIVLLLLTLDGLVRRRKRLKVEARYVKPVIRNTRKTMYNTALGSNRVQKVTDITDYGSALTESQLGILDSIQESLQLDRE